MSSTPPPPQPEKNIATLIAFTGGLIVMGGLIAFLSMVTPFFLYMVLVAFGFVLLIAFHYFTWGRWLSKQEPEDEYDDD